MYNLTTERLNPWENLLALTSWVLEMFASVS